MHPDQPARLAGSLSPGRSTRLSRLHRALDRPNFVLPPEATASSGCFCARRAPASRTAGSQSGPVGDDVNITSSEPRRLATHITNPASTSEQELWIRTLDQAAGRGNLRSPLRTRRGQGECRRLAATSGPETSTNHNDHTRRAQADILCFLVARATTPRDGQSAAWLQAPAACAIHVPLRSAVAIQLGGRRTPKSSQRESPALPTGPTHDAESLRHRSPPPAPR